MKKDDVLKHFGDDSYAVAAALGITRQAVEKWPPVIPERCAYRLVALTKGRLKMTPALYEKPRRRT